MKDLHPIDVRGFVAELRDNDVPDPSIRKHMLALKVLLATAYEDRDISSNPTQGVSLGLATSDDKVKVMTRAQLGLVLAAVPVEWQPFFTFLGQTGLRISEAIGLQWHDVELGGKHPHVKVRRQLLNGQERKLKSSKSRRDVPLTPGMVDTLLALRGKRYGGPDAPVWATKRGQPLEAHNVRNRVLRPVVRDLGLLDDEGKPWIGFHTFRHTCASLLFAGGKDVKQVQGWLGHAKASFTLDTYVHLMDDGLGDADFLDDVVRSTRTSASAA